MSDLTDLMKSCRTWSSGHTRAQQKKMARSLVKKSLTRFSPRNRYAHLSQLRLVSRPNFYAEGFSDWLLKTAQFIRRMRLLLPVIDSRRRFRYARILLSITANLAVIWWYAHDGRYAEGRDITYVLITVNSRLCAALPRRRGAVPYAYSRQ